MFEFDNYTYFSLSVYPLLLHFPSHVEDTKFNSANLIFIKTDKYRLTETRNVSSTNLVMGQVKILEWGEKLSPAKSDSRVSPPMVPDLEMLKKEIRASNLQNSEFFAGSTFGESPPPSALPLPSFVCSEKLHCNLLLLFEVVSKAWCFLGFALSHYASLIFLKRLAVGCDWNQVFLGFIVVLIYTV